MQLPVEVVRTGSAETAWSGETKNLSSCGVLFTSEADIPVGALIEYVITLPSPPSARTPVRLRCLGKVVRRESISAAATLERYEFIR